MFSNCSYPYYGREREVPQNETDSGAGRFSRSSLEADPAIQCAALQTLASGRWNAVAQAQYQHGMDIASQQLGNRAFMHWVGALHAAGRGGGAPADTVQGRQDPGRSAPLQFMPKKRRNKEAAVEVTPEGQTQATPETGAPSGAEAAATGTPAQATEKAVAGEKKKKKSRVQVALNTLRAEGVEAFKDYLEAEVDDTALLDTLTGRVQRAQDLAGVMDAALDTIAARTRELDPEGIPAITRALAPAHVQVVQKPLIAPARTVFYGREKEMFECCDNNNAGRLRVLLKHRRANVNVAFDHRTLLYIAALKGHTAVVRVLLSDPGINVNLAQEKGSTPLLIAADRGHVEIVGLLLEKWGIDPNLGTINEGTTPLAIAVHLGRKEVVKLLLGFRNTNIDIRRQDGATPLFIAVQNNDTAILKLLISAGADVNIPLTEGTSPLCRAAYQGRVDVVKQLLQAPGIQVDRTTGENVTALFFACQGPNKEIVELLLDKKADPNIADASGVAPLHLACLLGSREIAELLLDAGASVEMWMQNKYSPFHLACIGGHWAVMDLLESHLEEKEKQAVCQEGGQAPEDGPEQATPSGADIPAALPEAARQITGVAGRGAPAQGTAPGDMSRSIRARGESAGAMAGSRPRVAVSQSPLEQAKQELRQDILSRLRADWLDPLGGVRLLEGVNSVTDLGGLCSIHNRMAGIERKKLRSGRRPVRRPVSGADAEGALPVAGPAVFSLEGKRQLDAEAVEGEIMRLLEQRYHRFISQAVNDMEFGRGKPTTGYPGLLHVSAGIAGVGSCSVFFYVETEQNLISIVGVGHHLDQKTYQLDYAVEALGGSGKILRLS